jgi:SAM-dependent methyltransferase
MQLEPTGERMIMDHYKSSQEDFVIYVLHLATYRFAEAYTQGKRVLDYGCGSGYGSAEIAVRATHVTAVDVAEDAIEFARERFVRDNLDFRTIDPEQRLPFDNASFDTVLSFQVFEHVEQRAHYLSEIRRVLVPGGQLMLVTPDRSTRLLPGQRPWNRWHIQEYAKPELARLLAAHFTRVEVLGMTGKREMIEIELRRCRRVKWLALPFTLPIIPDRWRVASLNLIHKVRRTESRNRQPREYPYSVDDVVIAADAKPSVNLVALAS